MQILSVSHDLFYDGLLFLQPSDAPVLEREDCAMKDHPS